MLRSDELSNCRNYFIGRIKREKVSNVSTVTTKITKKKKNEKKNEGEGIRRKAEN